MTIPRRPNASPRARLLLLAAVGVLTIAACSDDYSGTNASPITEGGTGASVTTAAAGGESSTSAAGGAVDAAALAGHTFLSTQVDGQDLVADTQITLTFDDSTVGANAGCNTMTGGYKVDGGKLVVGQLAQTRMACEPALEAQDQWVAELLSGSPTIALDGANLTLEGGGTTAIFADRVSLSPQTRLDDTSWLIESLETDGTTMQAPDGAEMSFSNGSVNVITGCNNASGSADVQNETITFGPMIATLKACEAELQQWQDALLGFLQGSVAYNVTGDDLVLGTQSSRLTLTPLI
jgi:heat shock protein HslJ